MLWRIAVLVAATAVVVSSEKVRYDNHRVYRVTPTSEQQLRFLAGFAKYHKHIHFWKEATAVNRPVDLMVSPEIRPSFLQALEANGIEAKLIVENVQRLINSQRGVRRQGDSFGWEDYYNLEEINAWLNSLSEIYPGIVSPLVGGSSYEGREIFGVNITFARGNPIVVLESGIHANEWIGPATATWIINQMLITNDSTVRDTVRQFNFYIFPNLNPDGYEYTWTTDRMWRKTRTPYSPCYGADPNRNFGFHWGEAGASSITCMGSYAGPEPFSEVEARTFSEFLAGLGDDFQVYLDFHSSGQMLMFPYGLYDVVAPNYDELNEIAANAVEALATRYGTSYTYGSIVDTIYAAAGTTLDWVMGTLGKRFVFVWELRDLGQYGQLLPADQIIASGEETFDSVLSILRDVLARTNTTAAHKSLL